MKRIIPIFLALLLLAGCGAPAANPTEAAPTEAASTQPQQSEPVIWDTAQNPYESRFDSETRITLSDEGVKSSGPNSMSVFGSNDIIYYEDRDAYESGNPYGEGTDADKHTAEEAEKHYVVNITAPGAYRVTGKLSAGQLRIDLGEDAYEDESAVVELILEDADITCTVAPAIVFMNVYECDGNWSTDTARPDVDTANAGANLILEGENTVTGSYVAKIFKDKDGEKKLWKQDGAIYSYMSMNVYGPGALTLNADNEGLDTELHLTVNGGDITILSGNDGINTNEDGVSVTTINAGTLHIVAGLGEEGDGIDSNGYLVINGGTVISAAKPQSDAGLDSDLGSYIHGGTVVALGSSMDWAESDSEQVTMNLQFSRHQQGSLQVTAEDGTPVFTFDPETDPVLSQHMRSFQGAILSCPNFHVDDSYLVYADGQQMMYTSTDVMGRPGGFGGGRGEDFGQGGDRGQRPEGEMPTRPEGEMPEGGFGGKGPGNWGEGFDGQMPPEGFDGQKPADMDLPEGFGGEIPTWPEGEMPSMSADWDPDDRGNRGDRGQGSQPSGEGNTVFYMQDKVNFFSGLTAAE